MPKQVDHEQRRREITAALWRIASTEGLEAVSLNQVAAEAGISKGRVQHYFRSKDEMLAHATGLLRERVDERIQGELAARGEPRGARETLRAVLLALLPVRPESRTEALVNNAFLIRAIHDETVAERFRGGHGELRDHLTELIAAGQRGGEFAAGLDARREADILLAVAGGMADGLLLGYHDQHTASAIVDYQLDRMTPG